MHDDSHDPLDPRVAAFLEEVRATPASLPLPDAGAELATLFSSGIAIETSPRPATAGGTADGPAAEVAGPLKGTKGPQMLKKVFGSLAGKATAAAVGGLLAVSGLAVAGALPGGMQLVASNVADSVGVNLPSGGDSNVISDESNVATPTVGKGRDKKVNPGDPLPAPATTAAQAAHIHAFDVACGNHGAYVSYVARFGEEPACATAVRNGQTPNPAIRGQKGSDDAGEVEADDEKSPEEKAAKDRAKADREAARAQAEADREAAREKAEADREAARAQAEADREAARDKAKADREAARADKGDRRGGGRR